ncbi:serine/threonine-protein kinase [Actinoplanes solisilvae]|uniref:serine/threonine-protein kinase n=1 Tax=Actinoplanes solisilvae TaxID=2486853 RepID=UPI001F0BB10E|nr:serine/threonine-protein kinase [Actinoplanes solisilvae]
MLSPGAFLNDRYHLTQRIAAGGMGEVWRGEDTLLHRPVAVKVVLPGLMADQEFMARFRTEARMMAALRHPGIVQVYDYGESAAAGGGRLDYLVMEFIEGVSLAKRIEQAGRLSPDETMTVVAQVADALQVAHEAGIVHRDVKPANLLVRPNGSIVLVDFGVARSAAGNGLTGTNVVLGSVNYMAPEQAEGKKVTPATDVYALGAVAYCCLTGRPPYVGDNPLQVMSQLVYGDLPALPGDVPPPVAALVLRTLAKDPAQRFASAAELAAAARNPGRGAAMRPPTQATRPFPGAPSQTSGRMPIPGGGYPTGRQGYPSGSQQGYPSGPQQNYPSGPQQGFPSGPHPMQGTRPMNAAPGGYQQGRVQTGGPSGGRASVGAAAAVPPAMAESDYFDSGPEPRSGSGGNRRSLVIAAAVVAVVLGIGGIGIALLNNGDPDQGPSTGGNLAAGAGPSEQTDDDAQPASTGKPTTTKKPKPTTKTPKGENSPSVDPSPSEAVNPHTAEEVCGAGYEVVEKAALRDGGKVVGRAYLLRSEDDGQVCAVTIKAVGVGKKTDMSAYVEVDGKDRQEDFGEVEFYAGPMKTAAPEDTCIKWGGSIGNATYDSPGVDCD